MNNQINQTIKKIRSAKLSHKRWVSHALALIEGIPVEKDQVPVNYTDCAFGQWYYSDGQTLKNISEFNEIEKIHSELHIVYMDIFKILFKEKKQSFWSKLIGSSTKQQITETERNLAREKYRKLDDISNKIVQKLDQLEQVLVSLDE